MPIPWLTIVKQAPVLLAAADALLSSSRRRVGGPSNELPDLHQRLAAVEEHQRAQTELVKQLADQVHALAAGVQANARTTRVALGLALGAVGVSVLTALLAWLT
jgi:hypothetical protein